MSETTGKKSARKSPAKPAPTTAPKKPVTKASVAKVKPAAASRAAAKPQVATHAPAPQKAAGKARVARAQPAPSADRPIVMISDEQRYRMVAEAAYYRAERNAFKSDPVRDWIEAEHDIELLLNGQS